jgi:DNA modification methylase
MQGAKKIEWKSIDKLIPYAKNARTHSDEQIAEIAGSIKAFGFNNPVSVDKDNSIIAGHGRVLAARKLGMDKVPVVMLEHLTESERKAYVLADNRIALNSGWDTSMLSLELQDLQDKIDLSLLGFDPDELDALLNPIEETEGLTDEDAVPDVPDEPKTKLGDIYILGKHRLMCGDSTSIGDVDKLMIGVYPDLIHTDPPYGMNAVSKSAVLKKNYKIDIMGDNNPDVAKDAFNLIYGLYPNAKQIWWGANYYCSVLPDSECWLVWDKNNGQSDQTDCELAWANFRSVVRQFTQSSEKTNRVHPTQKPVSLMEWIIKRFNLSSKTIADFFGGSGSTLIAAEKNGLQAYIMEFDPKFCDVIVKRWEDFTGKTAQLVELSELVKA